MTAPRGDGHPVLVLPGFITTDRSTIALRKFLQSKGWDAHGWELGRNFGPIAGIEEGMARRVTELCAKTGRKVSLVGWSLGGVYGGRYRHDVNVPSTERVQVGRETEVLGCL